MAYFSGESGDANNNNKRMIRYSPHYITGLGDGNVKQLRNAPPRKDDDVYDAYLRYGAKHTTNNNKNTIHHRASRATTKRDRTPLSSSSSSWSSFFYKSHGVDMAAEYDPVDAAAPWQLSAFALLGAVVLLSALFLHVLADTAAENAHRHQQQQRSRQHRRTTNNNTTRKEKLKDDDDSHSESNMWAGSYFHGTNYDDFTDRRSDHSHQTVTTATTSSTAQQQQHQQPQQQQPLQQPLSLYYPYPQGSRLRRVPGASTSYYNNHRVYQLNPPPHYNSVMASPGPTRRVASPAPSTTTTTSAVSSSAMGTTSHRSNTTQAPSSSTTSTTTRLSPTKTTSTTYTIGMGKTLSLTPPPAYKAPRRPANSVVGLHPKSEFLELAPSLQDSSMDDSSSGDPRGRARHTSRSTTSRVRAGASSTMLPTVTSAESLEPEQESDSEQSPLHLDVQIPGRNSNSSDRSRPTKLVESSSMEETPRQVNGRHRVSSPVANAMPLLPVLRNSGGTRPEKKLEQRPQELSSQTTTTPRPPSYHGPPSPVVLDDLHEIMESGNIPPHWHSSRSVIPPSPPSPPEASPTPLEALDQDLSTSSFCDDIPIKINNNDVSSHGSHAANDPRFNIDHVRSDLTHGTNSAASLQGAIDFSELKLEEVIGGGGFGQVWKAKWRSTPVAVKVLTGSAQSQKVPRAVLEEFAAEINLLRGMRHPNICLYMGACLQPPNRAIITELAANGSLWDALRLPLNPPYRAVGRPDGLTYQEAWPPILYQPDPRHGMPPSASASNSSRRMTTTATASVVKTTPSIPEGQWPWALVKRVACGTARGMAYLHSGVPPVLHRDLKSANILLDESYTPKVCDFGLSRLQASTNSSMTGNCGTVQWMAPEVLANQKYNEKADVFSYGIILWELLTRACPYEGMGAVQCALAVLNRDHRPVIPHWCPPFLQALIRACWKTDPQDRPTFAQILAALEAMP